MAGFFGESIDDPRTQMILAMASGLLGNRGNFGQGVSAGLMGGVGAFNDARKMQMAQQQQEAQRKYQQMQMEEMQAQIANRKALMEQQAAMQSDFAGAITPMRDANPVAMDDEGNRMPPAIVGPQINQPAWEAALARWQPKEFADYLEKKNKPPANPSAGMPEFIDLQSRRDALVASIKASGGDPTNDPRVKELNSRLNILTLPPTVPVTYIQDNQGLARPTPAAVPRGAALPPPIGRKVEPLPPTIVKEQDALIDEQNLSTNINRSMTTHISRLKNGELPLSPKAVVGYEAANAVGRSTPQSVAYAEMRGDLEKMRNDSLRLNKGTQTEGDAQRAWNELFRFMTDPKVVANRMEKIVELNNRAIQEKQRRINAMRKEYGKPDLEQTQGREDPLGLRN